MLMLKKQWQQDVGARQGVEATVFFIRLRGGTLREPKKLNVWSG